MKAGKYHVRFTRAGWFYIGVTVFIGFGAINTGNNLLFIIVSLMLSLMVLSGVGSLRNFSKISVAVEVPDEVFAGVPAPFALRVSKEKGPASFLAFATAFGEARLPFLDKPTEVVLWLTFAERGPRALDELRIRSGFPLGFIERWDARRVNIEVLVYPRPVPEMFPPLSGESEADVTPGGRAGEVSDEVRELRGFRDGDTLKRVDWKATARKGEMVVRDLYHLTGTTLAIELPETGPLWETALSRACFLVLEGLRKELAVSLRLGDRLIDAGQGPEQRKRLLDALARA